MAILDIFKKKKPKKKEKPKKKPIEKKRAVRKNQPQPKADQPRAGKAEQSRAGKPAATKKRPVKGLAWKVLASPHVTEKATDLEKDNKYVFEVFKKANKIEVKKAVEGLYDVNVEKVAIINIPKKKRRAGRQREGWRKGYKKAIVQIRKGQKIEIMPR